MGWKMRAHLATHIVRVAHEPWIESGVREVWWLLDQLWRSDVQQFTGLISICHIPTVTIRISARLVRRIKRFEMGHFKNGSCLAFLQHKPI